jgi:hypothetical protein
MGLHGTGRASIWLKRSWFRRLLVCHVLGEVFGRTSLVRVGLVFGS